MLVTFFTQFRKRGGLAVFASGIGGKVISLLVAIVIARWLDPEVYGHISYAVIVVGALLPFSGGGFDTALLRYGAVAMDEDEKRALSKYALTRGMMLSVALLAVVAALAEPICGKKAESLPYLYIIMFLLLGDYIFRGIEVHLRIFKKNRIMAMMSFCRAGALLLLVLCLVPFIDGTGYAYALASAPLLVAMFFLVYLRNIRGADTSKISTSRPELWRFAILIGLGSILSRFQFFMDGIIVGNLIDDPEALAHYRVASLLPINLLMIPAMFFQSEYVHITENHDKRSFIVGYLKRYGLLAMGLSFGLIAVTQLFGELIITLIFGLKYASSAPLFKVLIFGLSGAYLLRQPFGILLNASGRADLNVVNSVISTVVTLSLLVYLILTYGLMGAAVGTAIAIWVSGFLSLFAYLIFVFPKLK